MKWLRGAISASTAGQRFIASPMPSSPSFPTSRTFLSSHLKFNIDTLIVDIFGMTQEIKKPSNTYVKAKSGII